MSWGLVAAGTITAAGVGMQAASGQPSSTTQVKTPGFAKRAMTGLAGPTMNSLMMRKTVGDVMAMNQAQTSGLVQSRNAYLDSLVRATSNPTAARTAMASAKAMEAGVMPLADAFSSRVQNKMDAMSAIAKVNAQNRKESTTTQYGEQPGMAAVQNAAGGIMQGAQQGKAALGQQQQQTALAGQQAQKVSGYDPSMAFQERPGLG